LLRTVQQGFDYAQQGAQLIQQFVPQQQQPAPSPPPPPPGNYNYNPAQPSAASAYPAQDAGAGYSGYSQVPQVPPAPTQGSGAYDVPATSPSASSVPQVAQGGDQLASLLQALRVGNIPALGGASWPSQVTQPPATPTAAPGRRLDATALLGLLLSNPLVQQTVQSAAVLGASGPRTVEVPVPNPAAAGRVDGVQLPPGAIVNALRWLAGESLAEMNAFTGEEDAVVPPHLVGESGDFLVDPTDPDRRAALATHYLRIADEAERTGLLHEAEAVESESSAYAEGYEDMELSESELWAQEAGF
jgi:hypothetical protein